MVSSLIRNQLLSSNGLKKSFINFKPSREYFRPIGCLCSIAWRPVYVLDVCSCVYHLEFTCPIADDTYKLSGHTAEGVNDGK
jgi:hypothetical protein